MSGDIRTDIRTDGPDTWNEIAWNGISFWKPACWEIVTIGRHYLMMGTPARLCMELRWQDPPGHYRSPADRRKRMERIRKAHLRAADAWVPDPEWQAASSAYDAAGFAWKRPERAGRGLVLSCPFCRRVSLIQFFQNPDEPADPDGIAPRVLASFRDHAPETDGKWAVFDIRAVLPSHYTIQSFRFSAGFIEMAFAGCGERIGLYRWSPASVLLTGKKLRDFAQTLMPETARSAPAGEDDTCVAWEERPSSGLWRRVTGFLPGRFPFLRFLLRHDTAANRILGIKAESRTPMEAGRFDSICSNYEITAP